jgi:hypothetical protein
MKQTICILIFFLVISELNGMTPNRFEERLIVVKDENEINQIKNKIRLIDDPTKKSDNPKNIKFDLNDKWTLIYYVYSGQRISFDNTTRHFEYYYIANNQITETLTSREILIDFNIIDTSSPPNIFPNNLSQIGMPSPEYLKFIYFDSYIGNSSMFAQRIYYFRKVNE